MSIRVLALFFPLLLLQGACDTTRPSGQQSGPATRSAPAPEIAHHKVQPPLTVKVQGPGKVSPGEKLSLEVNIKVQQPDEPLRLRVQVPPGATLLQGTEEETITEGPRVVRTLMLQLDAIPSEDLLVTVEQSGRSWGARGTASYRFGRPEPTLPQANALGVRRPGIPGAAIPLPPQ